MYLKFWGASLIILAAYFFGHNISSMYRNRVCQLEELLLGLEMFLTEITYGLTPLPQAFINIGKKLKDPVGRLFSDTAWIMQKSRGLSARECWKKALKNNSGALEFFGGGLELLDRLGFIWGKGDKSGQLRQIALMQELLRQAHREAQQDYQKNEKMWKYLGLLGGLTLVIFLI
ncbi:MAG: hypothetical protein C4554_03250 [Dethiobacter sp.]|jgi:stage III sporulation protein AB|nr:MAG: hypothetical protein C4554_03250 [Dethiobacter sp.]